MGDILSNAPFGAMLPSPSVLTGNYRPQTASSFMEQTLAEVKARAGGSRLGTPALSQQSQPQSQAKGSVEEVSALRSMASKHLGHLRHSRPAPYLPQQPPLPSRCLSTPPLRSHPATPPPPATPPAEPQPPPPSPPLQVSFDLPSRELSISSGGGGGDPATPTSHAGALQQSGRLGSSGGGCGAGAAAAAAGGCASGGVPDSPTTVAAVAAAAAAPAAAPVDAPLHHPHPHGLVSLCSSHPLFTSHQLLPRLVVPLDDLVAAAAPATLSGTSPTAALWAGGGAASPHGGGRLAPPQHHPLSPSASATPQPYPQPHPHAYPHTPYPVARYHSLTSSNSSRPSTSLSVQDLSLPKPGARVGSRSPTRGSGTQFLDLSRTGTASSGGGGGGEAAAGLAVRGSISSGGGGGGCTVVASPGRGSTRFQHTVTRWAAEAAAQGVAAEGTRLPNGLRVTRGMLYSVFQELDEFDSGRLTYSAFEQAACKIGMRPAQAKRMFEHLDPQRRGYATMREWSSPGLQRQMEAFTRLYVQATRASDGRPKDTTEVRSMHMAIQMAMVKLQLKRSGRAVSLDRLVQAFAYMDRDCNGALNAEEVEDALNSLGIFVTKEVVETIMRTFDKDGNGAVDYFEFVKSLYPTLDSSVYHH